MGLMLFEDMAELVPGLAVGGGQHCEIYLRCVDAVERLERLEESAGGKVLFPVAPRPWGEDPGYGWISTALLLHSPRAELVGRIGQSAPSAPSGPVRRTGTSDPRNWEN